MSLCVDGQKQNKNKTSQHHDNENAEQLLTACCKYVMNNDVKGIAEDGKEWISSTKLANKPEISFN